MSDRIIVANPKQNQNWGEVTAWIEYVGPQVNNFQGTVVFCPNFLFLQGAKYLIGKNNFKIKLGSQDVSQFEKGKQTGETAASQLAEFVTYSIIGHSERREKLKEDEKQLELKVKMAKAAKIEPIFCVQDENTPIPDGVSIVAYEPPGSIGNDNPQPKEEVKDIIEKIRGKGEFIVLYGGSVAPDNVAGYITASDADGVLVATHSLNPQDFTKILEAVNS